MLDSTSPDSIPLNEPIVAGYDDGSYGPKDGAGWTAAAWLKFTGEKVHITVTGLLGSLVADVENGDLTPTTGAQWCKKKINAGMGRPTLYFSTSLLNEVKAALATQGLQLVIDVDWWEARYDGTTNLNPYSVARQYQGNVPAPTGHGIVDRSATNGVWPEWVAPAPVVTGEDMISSTPSGNGYWVCKPDGSVWSYGDAQYYGGCNVGASQPMPAGHTATGFAVHPTGKGYWISTDFAGVYSFGDAKYYGAPNQPVTTLKLGKLDPEPIDGLKFISAYETEALPPVPDAVPVPVVADWRMCLNDQYGDCTIAGVVHADMTFNVEVDEADPIATDPEIKTEYFGDTGGPDSGLAETFVLNKWRSKGLFKNGKKIKAFAPVDHTNVTAIKESIAYYGGCYFGVQLPQSAQQQFVQGGTSIWSVVAGSPIEGGHCIWAVGYDETGIYIISWGQVVLCTYEWIAKYLDEAYAIISNQFIEAGKGPNLDLASLEADLPAI